MTSHTCPTQHEDLSRILNNIRLRRTVPNPGRDYVRFLTIEVRMNSEVEVTNDHGGFVVHAYWQEEDTIRGRTSF